MKKIVFLFIVCFLFYDVFAIEVAVSTTGEYDGVFSDGSTIAIAPGKKESIIVHYGNSKFLDAGDKTDLGRIDVSLTIPSGVSLSTSNKYLEEGDTLSGSGNNYKITINNNLEEFDGVGVFTLKVPNVTSTTEYPVTITAKSYNKSGSLLQTKTGKYKLLVLAKPTNCDNNSEVSISTTLGELKKDSGAYYSLNTNESKVNITINPKSSKTKVSGYLASGEEKEKQLQNNSTGNINLDYGKNMIMFFLTTECYELGEKNEEMLNKSDFMVDINRKDISYSSTLVTVDITRNDNRSKDSTLKDLTISDVTISFKPELKNYVATVPYKTSSVTIKSLLNDSKSSYVSGFGNRTVNLKEGLNTIQVKVKAENESVSVYSIKITREKNDDSSLKSLTVNDKEISLKDGLLVYSINVDNSIVKPNINAVANDSKAKVDVEKISDLQEGDNEVNITVTASNGMKSVYVINIIRDKLISNNSKLKKLEVTNHEIDFSSDKTEYNVHINYDIEKLDLIIEPDHEKAKYIVTGNKDLEDGSIIKIKVTAEDEETITTYTINITKEKKPFNILFVIIPIALLLIIVTILIIVKKKKDSNANKSSIIDNNTNINNTNLNSNSTVNNTMPNSFSNDNIISNENSNIEKSE